MAEKMPSLQPINRQRKTRNEASSRIPKDCDLAAGPKQTLLCVGGEEDQ